MTETDLSSVGSDSAVTTPEPAPAEPRSGGEPPFSGEPDSDASEQPPA